jgi:hypothetical protein
MLALITNLFSLYPWIDEANKVKEMERCIISGKVIQIEIIE